MTSRTALLLLCAVAPALVGCRELTRSQEITIAREPALAPAPPPPPPVDRAAMNPSAERGAPPTQSGG